MKYNILSAGEEHRKQNAIVVLQARNAKNKIL